MTEVAKVQQVMQQFFVKCAQLTTQARVVPAPLVGKSNRWFNLKVEDIDVLRDDLRPWRAPETESTENTAFALPTLVIETTVAARGLTSRQRLVLVDSNGHSHTCEKPDVVLERVVVEFRPGAGQDAEVPIVYKRSIVALRVLYTLLRLLPSWSLRERVANAQTSNSPLVLNVCVTKDIQSLSATKTRLGLSKRIDESSTSKSSPQTLEGHLASHVLAPVETPLGTLHVSVSYRTEVNFRIDENDSLELEPSKMRPVYTRPFRTPSSSSLHRLPSGSVPVPVPAHSGPAQIYRSGSGHEASTSSIVSASTASPAARFSSSFSRPRRQPSREASPRTLGYPVGGSAGSGSGPGSGPGSGGSRPTSHACSLDSQASTGTVPSSGLYMAHSDVGEFVRFIDEAQKQAGSVFRSSNYQTDTSLSRFQQMLQSNVQLSLSMSQYLAQDRDQGTAPDQSSTARGPRERAQSGSPQSLSSAKHMHQPTTPSRLGEEFPKRRASALRSRLSYYGDDGGTPAAEDDPDISNSEQMMFAFSEM